MSLVNIRVERREVCENWILGELTVQTPFVSGIRRISYHTFRCATLEPLWACNQNKISCVPANRYSAYIRTDINPNKAVQRHWRLQLRNVPNRGDIQIHWGTTRRSSTGCIVVGMRWSGSKMLEPEKARDHIRTIVEMAGDRPDIWVDITENEAVRARNSSWMCLV